MSFPLDLLLLLIIVPAHMHLGGVSFLYVIPLLIYTLLEFWHPLSDHLALPEQFNRTRFTFLARLALILIIAINAVLIPTVGNIFERLVAETDESGYSEVYAEIHDGAIQVEYALAYLNAGKNPYVETYEDTPLRFYLLSGVDLSTNPAVDYFVYLPGYLLSSFPAYKLFEQLDFPYDQRWVYLATYLIVILLIPTIVKKPTLKLSLLIGIALNPLLTGPVLIGMNDVVVFLFVFVAILALSKERFLLSAVFFGTACAFKQSAWFILPFYMLFVFRALPEANRMRGMVKTGGILAILMALIVGPFIIWDFSAFFTDVFSYPSGAVAINYPIRGYTLGVLLVGMGVISSPLNSFPFWIFQLLVGLPLGYILLKYQWKKGGIGSFFFCSGIFIFGIGFASRFFQDNYVGFVTLLLTVGILLIADEGEDVSKPLTTSAESASSLL